MFSFLRTAGGDTRTRNRRNRRTPPKNSVARGRDGLGHGVGVAMANAGKFFITQLCSQRNKQGSWSKNPKRSDI